MARIIRGYKGDWGESVVGEPEAEESLGPKHPISGDEILDRMGGSFDGMNGRDLMNYFLRRFEERFGYEIRSSTGWNSEQKIFAGFASRFKEDAGPMIQLLFVKHGGLWNREPVGPQMFSASHDYFQQSLYHDLQRRRRLDHSSSGGFMTLAEFNRLMGDTDDDE